ncbi:Response regulator receiver protein [Rubripirellula amarantea]|uniref:Response regulator receiver protein n=1 Tax=Rubripirellula amarantea TaxID=2527999 RepID=A0A5C5WN63_9BACT|nr:response regulator [Rubripirellula amarantea]TWT51232.1 Response regulator receiver protein [Rubripirellula amarantea]
MTQTSLRKSSSSLREPISVLVVDDESDNAANLADILEDLNYRVDIAHNGNEALELLKKKCYSFALLDYQMPGMNGAELYEEIKKVQPCLVAFMITAYAGSDGVQRALDLGTWKVLRKPIDLCELLGAMGTACNQPLVLVVDDDVEFSANAWQVLRDSGFRVCTAASEAEAVQRIGQMSFDIVLLDLRLGSVEEGKNVFYAAQQSDHCPSIYLVTGQSREAGGIIEQLVRDNASGVFTKPVDLGQLLKEIKGEESK